MVFLPQPIEGLTSIWTTTCALPAVVSSSLHSVRGLVTVFQKKVPASR